MDKNYRPLILPALIALLLPVMASAEEADDEYNFDDVSLEEILVLGVRMSLAKAQETKKQSVNVVDVVAAEGIGALPAISIADTLDLIPGIQTEDEDGRAVSIGIRGLDSNFTLTTINGREVASTRPVRGVPLNIYPGAVIDQAIIHKSVSADSMEGGIAGTIELETPRPLNYDSDLFNDYGLKFQANARAEYNSIGEDVAGDGIGYRGSFGVIGQFDDGKYGFGYTLVNVEGDAPSQEYDIRWRTANIRYRDVNGDGEFNKWNNSDQEAIVAPSNFNFRQNNRSDDRLSHLFVAQYRHNDWDINLDLLHSTANVDNSESRFESLFVVGSTWQNRGINYDQIEREELGNGLDYTTYVQMHGDPEAWENATPPNGNRQLGFGGGHMPRINIFRSFDDNQEKSTVFGLNANKEFSEWSLNFDVSHSKASMDSKTRLTQLHSGTGFLQIIRGERTQNPNNPTGTPSLPVVPAEELSSVGVEFDLRGQDFPTFDITGIDLNDPDSFAIRTFERGFERSEDELTSLNMDLTRYFVESDRFSQFSAGFRITQRERSNTADLHQNRCGEGRGTPAVPGSTGADAVRGSFCRPFDPVAATDVPIVEFPENFEPAQGEFDNFLPGLSGLPSTWLSWDPQGLESSFFGETGFTFGFDQLTDDSLANTWSVEEDTFSGYALFDIDSYFAGMPFTGDIGLRIINTNHTVNRIATDLVSSQVIQVDVEGETKNVLVLDSNIVDRFNYSDTDFTFQKTNNSYTDILPSFNFRFETADDVFVRFSAAKVLSRPRLEDLGQGTVFQSAIIPDVNDDGVFNAVDFGEATINASSTVSGNPRVNPFRARQADIALEWYKDENSSYSIGFFWKSIKEFVASDRISFAPVQGFSGEFADSLADSDGDGVPDAIYDAAALNEIVVGNPGSLLTTDKATPKTVAAQLNSVDSVQGGLLRGVEVQFQQAFTFLPAPFDGMGIQGNYTYLDTGAKEEVTDVLGNQTQVASMGASKNKFNGQIYFEYGDLSVRLIHNWRSKYNSNRASVFERKERDTTSISGRYSISDNISITLQAQNIFDSPYEDFYHIGSVEGGESANVMLPATYESVGQRIFLGVSATF